MGKTYEIDASTYETLCQRCYEDGIREAAKMIWEAIVEDVGDYWDRERLRRDAGEVDVRASEDMKTALGAYGMALSPLGCSVWVTEDPTDAERRVHEVKLVFDDGTVGGCVRSFAGSEW